MPHNVDCDLHDWERREPKIVWAGAEVKENNGAWAEWGAEGRRAGMEWDYKNIAERWAAILPLTLRSYALFIISSDIIYVFNLCNLIITL